MKVKNDIVIIKVQEYDTFLSTKCKNFKIDFCFNHSRNRILVEKGGISEWKYDSTLGIITTKNIWGFRNGSLFEFKRIQKGGVISGEISLKMINGTFRVNRSSVTFKDKDHTPYFMQKSRFCISDTYYDDDYSFCRLHRVKALKESDMFYITLFKEDSYYNKSLGDLILHKTCKSYYQTDLIREGRRFYGPLSDYLFKDVSNVDGNKIVIFEKR